MGAFTPDSGCHLPTLAVPHSKAPVSPGMELLHTSGARIFTSGDSVSETAMQGMSLDRLVLEARWACVPGSRGTVTIQEIVLGKLLPCLTPHKGTARTAD